MLPLALCYGHGPQLARRARRSAAPTVPVPSKSAGRPGFGPACLHEDEQIDHANSAVVVDVPRALSGGAVEGAVEFFTGDWPD